jgi:hypothetical protein
MPTLLPPLLPPPAPVMTFFSLLKGARWRSRRRTCRRALAGGRRAPRRAGTAEQYSNIGAHWWRGKVVISPRRA